MAAKKLAGIYRITLPDGKVYIGSSGNLRNRFKRYYWAVTTDKEYDATKTKIAKAIKKYGWENIKIEILECGEQFKDNDYRVAVESAYILQHKSYDPRYGYNGTCADNPNFEGGYGVSRPQSALEKIKRAKPVFIYNFMTEQTFYVMGGAKSAGEYFGFTKDVASHAVKKGVLVKNEWYIIPATNKDLTDAVQRSSKRKYITHARYLDAVNRIIDIAKEFYGIELTYSK